MLACVLESCADNKLDRTSPDQEDTTSGFSEETVFYFVRRQDSLAVICGYRDELCSQIMVFGSVL